MKMLNNEPEVNHNVVAFVGQHSKSKGGSKPSSSNPSKRVSPGIRQSMHNAGTSRGNQGLPSFSPRGRGFTQASQRVGPWDDNSQRPIGGFFAPNAPSKHSSE